MHWCSLHYETHDWPQGPVFWNLPLMSATDEWAQGLRLPTYSPVLCVDLDWVINENTSSHIVTVSAPCRNCLCPLSNRDWPPGLVTEKWALGLVISLAMYRPKCKGTNNERNQWIMFSYFVFKNIQCLVYSEGFINHKICLKIIVFFAHSEHDIGKINR